MVLLFRVILSQLLSAFALVAPTGTPWSNFIWSMICQHWLLIGYLSGAIRRMGLRWHIVHFIFDTWSITSLADFLFSFSFIDVWWIFSTLTQLLLVTIFEYTECQAFCPVVRIGSPRPLTRKRVLRPPLWFRGGHTRQAGEWAGGANSDDWIESLAF